MTLPFHGMAHLMTLAYQGTDLTPLAQTLLEQSNQPTGANAADAMMDLSIILHVKGHHDIALALQQQALKHQQIYWLPAKMPGAIRLLAFVTSGPLAANTPVEFLVGNRDVDLTLVYVAPDLPFPKEIPEHDVLFMAVGESDGAQLLLRALSEVIQIWPKPVLNLPERVARLARDSVSHLLADIPGLVVPSVLRLTREQLQMVHSHPSLMGPWTPLVQTPFLLRPVDTHAGQGLERLEQAAQIPDYLARQPETTFFMIPFVDYANSDGLYRKYRIALIDGKPYASHMALSSHWMIHYLNGGMGDSAAKRAEEAHFMSHFEQEFARRHRTALTAVHHRLGLDYLVLDCAETASGELLIFEADSSAVIHAMDPVDVFPYKQEPMQKAFSAFKDLLQRVMSEPVRPRDSA